MSVWMAMTTPAATIVIKAIRGFNRTLWIPVAKSTRCTPPTSRNSASKRTMDCAQRPSETFLVADTRTETVREMPFLTLGSADIRFAIGRSYTAANNQAGGTLQCEGMCNGGPRDNDKSLCGSVSEVKNIFVTIPAVFGPHQRLLCRLHRGATRAHRRQ